MREKLSQRFEITYDCTSLFFFYFLCRHQVWIAVELFAVLLHMFFWIQYLLEHELSGSSDRDFVQTDSFFVAFLIYRMAISALIKTIKHLASAYRSGSDS